MDKPGSVRDGEDPVRELWDYASFDMHIDNALALNKKITTFDDIYYFAKPCSSTIENADGSVFPDPSVTESIFMKGAIYMSGYTGTTKGGFRLSVMMIQPLCPGDGMLCRYSGEIICLCREDLQKGSM